MKEKDKREIDMTWSEWYRGPPKKYNADYRHYTLFYQVRLKNGAWSKRTYPEIIEFTPLNKCDICGKVSTPKKVNCRTDCYHWYTNTRYDNGYNYMNILCMPCWNKVRSIMKKEEEAKEINSLYKKLKREITNERKRSRNN